MQEHSAQLAEPLLRELVGFAQLLSDVNNESMLQLALPWITHFGAGLRVTSYELQVTSYEWITHFGATCGL